jgi:hypothetical protein
MRKFTILAVSGTFVLAADTFALADSKSAADFLIETCLPAMDNVSKVEAMAREANWTPKPDLKPPSQFRTSNSRWEVTKGEEKFSVFVWINHLAQQDYNICFVNCELPQQKCESRRISPFCYRLLGANAHFRHSDGGNSEA